jgi:hypothetical protein
MELSTSSLSYALAAALALSISAGALAQTPTVSVNVPVTELKFYEPGKEKIPVAKGYGDPASEPRSPQCMGRVDPAHD